MKTKAPKVSSLAELPTRTPDPSLDAAKPPPGPRTAARIVEAGLRKADRAQRLEGDFAVTGNVGGVGPPHSDALGWQDVVLDSFGTTSMDFVNHEVDLIGRAQCKRDERAIGATELNATLAAIDGTRPENEMAAMLATQMAVTHSLAMEMLGRTRRAESIAHLESYGSLATKLSRTFVAQSEALAKLKRGGEQTVRVEHVHVYPGGQAIVGAVSNGRGGNGGSRGKGKQTSGTNDPRTLSFAPGSEMLGAQSGRQSVSKAGREGQEALPLARRR